jgi:O-antigen/teichoic acid export membrane protein
VSAIPEELPEAPKSGVSWVLVGSIVFFLAGAIFYLYLAHVLPTDELGSVVVLAAIAQLVSIAAALGLGTGFQHFLAYHKSRAELSNVRTLVRIAFAAAILLSLAAAGGIEVFSRQLSSFFFHTGSYSLAIELLGLYAGLSTAITLLQSVLIGLQRFMAFSTAYMTAAVATYGMAVVFLHLRASVVSIVLGWVVGSAAAIFLFVALVVRYSQQATVPLASEPPSEAERFRYRTLLLYSFPVLASALIGTSAAYVDRLVLATLVNLSTVGIYNYAILVATGSLFLVGPFQTILVPRISASFGKKASEAIRDDVRTAATLIVLVYVPFALGLAAVGPFLLRFFVGSGFLPASVPLALLLGITAVCIPYIVFIALASGIRRTGVFVHSASLALVSNVALSILLVPRFGMIGAAVGNSSMYWTAFLVMYFELRGTGLIRLDLGSFGRIWVASAIMCAAVATLLIFLHYDPLVIVPVVLLGVGIFLLSLRFVRAVPSEVATALVRFLPRWASAVRPVICWVAACDHCNHAGERTAPAPAAPLQR